jgi:hypothetical protein
LDGFVPLFSEMGCFMRNCGIPGEDIGKEEKKLPVANDLLATKLLSRVTPTKPDCWSLAWFRWLTGGSTRTGNWGRGACLGVGTCARHLAVPGSIWTPVRAHEQFRPAVDCRGTSVVVCQAQVPPRRPALHGRPSIGIGRQVVLLTGFFLGDLAAIGR